MRSQKLKWSRREGNGRSVPSCRRRRGRRPCFQFSQDFSWTLSRHSRRLAWSSSLPPSLPVWPELAIFCTLGNFLQPFATMNLPKSPTFLGNFSKGAKIIHFSNEIIFGNFYRHLAIFIWSRCSLPTMQHHQKVNNRHSLHLSQNNQKFEGSNLSLSFTQRVFPLHRYIFWPSVTRLGDFWKFLGQFSYKIGPNICWPLGMAILKQHPFWSKSCWVYLLSNF